MLSNLGAFLGWYVVALAGILFVALGGMAFESENDRWAAVFFVVGTALISAWGYVLAT